MAEEARLESVYTPKGYLGFESRSLRKTFIIKESASQKRCWFRFGGQAVESLLSKAAALRRKQSRPGSSRIALLTDVKGKGTRSVANLLLRKRGLTIDLSQFVNAVKDQLPPFS